MKYCLNYAEIKDIDEIGGLIERSARIIGRNDYSEAQIEGALENAWGVDSQLIKDRTYYVVTVERKIVGCGGWSYRKTQFGNDQEGKRDSGLLNPEVDAARIRGFFVDPNFARQGIATMVLNECEIRAQNAGFLRLEMVATYPGKKFYENMGYQAGEIIPYSTNHGEIEFISMKKSLTHKSGAGNV